MGQYTDKEPKQEQVTNKVDPTSTNKRRKLRLNEINSELESITGHAADSSSGQETQRITAVEEVLGSSIGDEAVEALKIKNLDEAEAIARMENTRFDELSNERKMLLYFKENLPDTEHRIEQPMDPRCEISLVIPAYAERDSILSSLASLTEQEGVSPEKFEVIIVVNNGEREPSRTEKETDADYARTLDTYRAGLKENQEVLGLIRMLQGEEVHIEVSKQEKALIEKIKKAGLRIYAIDKASQGNTLPQVDANVGGARNRGVAEAAARFYEQAGKNGIIAQSDADTKFDPSYIANLIRAFKDRPDLVGLTGSMEFEDTETPSDLERLVSQYTEANYKYNKLLGQLSGGAVSRTDEQKFLQNVHFSGANMASRAFEAAYVGGVPKLAGGEDPLFGERLSTIGVIDTVPNIRTRPANRLSARTAVDAGHGQSRIKMSETIQENRTLLVENPHKVLEKNRIRNEFFSAIQSNTATPERLAQILTVQDQPLLDESDIRKLSEKASSGQDIKELMNNKEMLELIGAFDRSLSKICPDLPLADGQDELFKLFNKNEKLREKFEAISRDMLKQEEANVEGRIRMLEGIFDLYAEDPHEHLDGPSLLAMIRTNMKSLGLDKDVIDGLERQGATLDTLAEILSQAKTRSKFFTSAKAIFKNRLTPPSADPMQKRLIEFSAMRTAQTELSRGQ